MVGRRLNLNWSSPDTVSDGNYWRFPAVQAMSGSGLRTDLSPSVERRQNLPFATAFNGYSQARHRSRLVLVAVQMSPKTNHRF